MLMYRKTIIVSFYKNKKIKYKINHYDTDLMLSSGSCKEVSGKNILALLQSDTYGK
jgi:hypothetical protein